MAFGGPGALGAGTRLRRHCRRRRSRGRCPLRLGNGRRRCRPSDGVGACRTGDGLDLSDGLRLRHAAASPGSQPYAFVRTLAACRSSRQEGRSRRSLCGGQAPGSCLSLPAGDRGLSPPARLIALTTRSTCFAIAASARASRNCDEATRRTRRCSTSCLLIQASLTSGNVLGQRSDAHGRSCAAGFSWCTILRCVD